MQLRKLAAVAAVSAVASAFAVVPAMPAGAQSSPSGSAGAQAVAPAQILHGFHLVGHSVPTTDTAYSSNWSGYVATGEKYTAVLGYWTVPTAHCGSLEFSEDSTWVGIDGWGDSTVEQGGTDSGCFAGVPIYYAWDEMYPADEVPLLHSIAPGDAMAALVVSNSAGTEYQILVDDLTQGWLNWSPMTASPADQDTSAEWISERPSCPLVCSDLTDFATVTFTSALATGNGTTGAISAFPNSPVDMDNGNLEAQVGPLTPSGTSFTDTWEHA